MVSHWLCFEREYVKGFMTFFFFEVTLKVS